MTRPGASCPRCGKQASLDPANKWRPFCSERCRLTDLGDWASGKHAIAAEDQTPPEAEPAPRPTRQ